MPKKPEEHAEVGVRTSPRSCFVIGPIGEVGSPERRHADFVLHGLIRVAAEPMGFDVKRADQDAKPGMISDRMIQDVIKSDLVIADLTTLNPNVFYELGIRHSVEKVAIPVALRGTRLPFDNYGHHTIFVDTTDWIDLEEARSQLAHAIAHTLEQDYRVTNPITQSNASFAMKNSEDPKDNLVSELREQVGRLSSQMRDVRSALSDIEGRSRPGSLFAALPATLPATIGQITPLSSAYTSATTIPDTIVGNLSALSPAKGR